jgi:hypothetical protein
MDVYFASEHHPQSVAQMPAHTGLRPGQPVTLFFDLQRVHFFEPGELGKSIAKNPRGLS